MVNSAIALFLVIGSSDELRPPTIKRYFFTLQIRDDPEDVANVEVLRVQAGEQANWRLSECFERPVRILKEILFERLNRDGNLGE